MKFQFSQAEIARAVIQQAVRDKVIPEKGRVNVHFESDFDARSDAFVTCTLTVLETP